MAGEVKPGSSLSFCPVAGLTADLPSAVLTRFFAGLDKPGREDVWATVELATSFFGGANSSLDDNEGGLSALNGVGGFFGVPRLVVNGSEDCGAGIVGGCCSSVAVGTGFGTASLEGRAGVAIRDFLLIGTALARGVGSLGGWAAAGCGSGSVISTSASSSGSSADVRGTRGSKALADTLEVRAFVFGGLSGVSYSGTCVKVSFHCTPLRTLSLCAFSTPFDSAESAVGSTRERILSPISTSLA